MKKYKSIIVLLIVTNIIFITLICNLVSKNGNVIKERQIIKEMTQSENESNLQTQIDQLNLTQQEYAADVQAYKKQIADAITNQGIETSENDKGSVMAENIEKIVDTKTEGTATESDILLGKTAWVNGKQVTGTLLNEDLAPDLSVTLKTTHTSQSGSTTKSHSISTYKINTISVSTSCSASHSGSYTVTGTTSDGTTTTLTKDSEIDVSEYDSLIFSITCKGRNNSGFSQTGTYSVVIEKID